MRLVQLTAPDLAGVAVGVPNLLYLEALCFSADGNQLLVRATYTDSYDPNGSDQRSAVWVYDVATQAYTTCLNVIVAGDASLAREIDILSASFIGLPGEQPQILVHSAIDDVPGTERLSLINGQSVAPNIIALALGADVRPAIQAYAVSNDGRFIAVQSDSSVFSELDTNTTSDIYLIDTLTRHIERVSLLAGAEVYKPVSLGNVLVQGNSVSVSFTTEASFSRLDGNEAQPQPDVATDAYVWSSAYSAEGLTGSPAFRLLSLSRTGTASGYVSSDPSAFLTADGAFFTSSAPGLVSGDDNGVPDVFEMLSDGTIRRIVVPGIAELQGGAQLAGASADGRYVTLLTGSPEIAGLGQVPQLVVVDQWTGKWVLGSGMLANDMVISAALAPSGSAVAFVSLATNLGGGQQLTLGGSLFLVTGLSDEFDSEAVGSVVVNGTVAEGGTVSASVSATDVDGAITGTTYQWQISANGTDGWSDISGATSSSYAIASDQSEVGKYLRVVAVTTDALGGTTTLTSDATIPISKPVIKEFSGTAGNDTLTGIAGSVSEITGGGGNDTITGGSRADVAVYSGNRSDYTIKTVAGVTTVVDNRAGSPDGTDTLKGLNILRFADIQLFQTTAANKMTLAGQAQTYNVSNSEVVQGTNAAEHFIIAPRTSALVFAGNNDVVDLSGAIDSYTFSKTGTQLQISDGIYTSTISVGGTVTLRTASGSTSVAIDYSQGGAIKLGGTQIVGSASFDPLAAILDAGNIPSSVPLGSLQTVTGTSGNDTLTGIAGSVSKITGGAGNDTITGGSRADVAVFSGNRSDYTITTVAGVTTVVDNRAGSPDGTDTLRGLNILRFADLQLFQTAAANKVTLAGQAQTYEVVNSEVVQGTNAAEHFIVAPKTSALVFAGSNDVVDLSGAIDSYTYSKTGTQLQISDGLYTTTLSVGGSFTLRTASGSTSVAIDYSQGGAIKLGGTQIVGSATFDPIAAILDPENYSDNAEFRQITVSSDASYSGHEGIVDVFVIDASQSLIATIVGFEDGDILEFRSHSEELGVSFQNTAFDDETATVFAGNATITLDSLANDNFGNEASFENIYGANAISYVM